MEWGLLNFMPEVPPPPCFIWNHVEAFAITNNYWKNSVWQQDNLQTFPPTSCQDILTYITQSVSFVVLNLTSVQILTCWCHRVDAEIGLKWRSCNTQTVPRERISSPAILVWAGCWADMAGETTREAASDYDSMQTVSWYTVCSSAHTLSIHGDSDLNRSPWNRKGHSWEKQKTCATLGYDH